MGLNFSTLDETDSKPFISSFTFIGDDNGSSMAANNDSRQSNGQGGGRPSQFDNQLEKLQQAKIKNFNQSTENKI